MKLIVDIDGTICTLEEGRYENARPFETAILFLNNMSQSGHSVTYYTGRGWDKYEFTLNQLRSWGCVFDQLICGKPLGTAYIDDLSFSTVGQFMDLFLEGRKNG